MQTAVIAIGLIALSALCVVNTSAEPISCPKNETFNKCAKICKQSCETQYLDLKYDCDCVPGCECDEGYVIDAEGKCILKTDCDPETVQCPADKIYSKCQIPDQNCQNFGTSPPFKRCQPGCYCKDGKILDDEGHCIDPSECNKPKMKAYAVDNDAEKCPGNETWQTCPCDSACSFYYQNVYHQCACHPGCGCQEGFIRNGEERCIKIDECNHLETNCPGDQHFSYSEERRTCTNLNPGTVTSGCFCNGTTVYDEVRKICVDPRECPTSPENQQCESLDPNSQYQLCQPKYYMKCGSPIIIMEPDEECRPDCYCKPDFVLGRAGKCMSSCNDECPANSSYSFCTNMCGNSCSQMFLDDIVCMMACWPGCNCDPGYVWNSLGQCVKKRDCTPEEIKCPERQTFLNCTHEKIRYCPETPQSEVVRKKPRPSHLEPESSEEDYEGTILDVPGVPQVAMRPYGIGPLQESTVDGCNWGCFCEAPFILDKATGECVFSPECTGSPENLKCEEEDPNSEYKACASSTRPTCKNKYPEFYTEDCNQTCRCKPGYFYNESTKKCVSGAECDQAKA